MSYPDDDKEMVEVEGIYVIRESELSIIIDYENEEIVVPKSQISPDSEVQGEGDEGILKIPRWLAQDRDLI